VFFGESAIKEGSEKVVKAVAEAPPAIARDNMLLSKAATTAQPAPIVISDDVAQIVKRLQARQHGVNINGGNVTIIPGDHKGVLNVGDLPTGTTYISGNAGTINM
jgi:hypothetical protein